MIESALTTFIAPAGVGIFILVIEYFGIRNATLPSVNIHTVFRVFMPILTVLLGIAFGLFIYQTNENRKLVSEIRQMIREDRQAESDDYADQVAREFRDLVKERNRGLQTKAVHTAQEGK